MKRTAPSEAQELRSLRAQQDAAWRNPAQVISHWEDSEVDSRLLRYSAQGAWWETLERLRVTLLVSREYEHLVMALRTDACGPALSYIKLPHPSGMAVDTERGIVHVASTRNPNQVWDFAPVTGQIPRLDVRSTACADRPLLPIRSRLFPGCLYMHDLAMIDGRLHANAVGQNAVVCLSETGRYERVWWPHCIECGGKPIFEQNHIQLNSIAAGPDLRASYFSASTSVISARRPGHRNFAVDRRGVLFSGATREPIAYGLTRPHSARLYESRVWVDNSGYGEVGYADGGTFVSVVRLPGWTRGLCVTRGVAFVGTSRVILRYAHYAPGVNASTSVCGVHAIDMATGTVLGSIRWPYGNQIFGIEAVPTSFSAGMPFPVGSKRARDHARKVMYTFTTQMYENEGREESPLHE